MAQGDLTIFEEFAKEIGQKIHELGADTIKVMLITNAVAATAATATPRKADFTECSGTGYAAGGAEIANDTWTEADGDAIFNGDDISWTKNAAGPTDIYQAVGYNDTDGSDRAIFFIDMTSDGGTTPISLANGNISITWNATGIFKIAA